METETAVEPVETTVVDTDSDFLLGTGKVFVVGAALGAGVYAGKWAVEWIRERIDVHRNKTVLKPVPAPKEAK